MLEKVFAWFSGTELFLKAWATMKESPKQAEIKPLEGKGNYTGRGKLQNYVSLVSPKELRTEIVIMKQEQGATERTFRRQKSP